MPCGDTTIVQYPERQFSALFASMPRPVILGNSPSKQTWRTGSLANKRRTEIASCYRELQAVVRTLTLPVVVPLVRFSLSPEVCSRSQGSSAFAAGQVKRQVKPEGA